MGLGPNRRGAIRRRRVLVALAACAALAAGVVSGAGLLNDDASSGQPPATTARPGAAGGAERPAGPGPASPSAATRRRVARLPLDELAGRAVVLRFAGPVVPPYVREALREGRAAGAILFADNATSPAVTRRIARTLRRAGGTGTIVCLDQEGGAVRVLPWAAPEPGQRAVTTPAAARRVAREAGRDLRANGITVTLAPVADVGRPGSALEARTYAGGAAATARLIAASVRGYRGTGVAPTVKHFPGLGAAGANTDDHAVDIGLSARALGAGDLPPFQAAIAAGVPAVMLSHARYPALDPDHIASQSRPIVTGLLKRRLGFTGVAMTDSLEARAVDSAADPGAAAVRSVQAGIDLVLTTGRGSFGRSAAALEAAARRSAGFRARLRDAVSRVETLRAR